jgi:hypothetical protein
MGQLQSTTGHREERYELEASLDIFDHKGRFSDLTISNHSDLENHPMMSDQHGFRSEYVIY